MVFLWYCTKPDDLLTMPTCLRHQTHAVEPSLDFVPQRCSLDRDSHRVMRYVVNISLCYNDSDIESLDDKHLFQLFSWHNLINIEIHAHNISCLRYNDSSTKCMRKTKHCETRSRERKLFFVTCACV